MDGFGDFVFGVKHRGIVDENAIFFQISGVEFHGFVEDLEPFLDGCRIAVAPLRYGAGVKGKVNSSMSYGQPVVGLAVPGDGSPQ